MNVQTVLKKGAGNMKKYYSTHEVCEVLGVSEVTMYKWIRKRRFEPPPVRKIAGVRVRAWVEQDVERARGVLKKAKQNADVSSPSVN